MKNLFVSFECVAEDGQHAIGNLSIPTIAKISDENDIIALQEYIEMSYGLQEVTLINWRRME